MTDSRMESTSGLHKMRGCLTSIESIRFLVALWVFYVHFGPGHSSETEMGRMAIVNNQGSVFCFIVISGFITHWTSRDVTFQSGQEIQQFYIRRFGRLLFAYEVAVLCSTIIRTPGLFVTAPGGEAITKDMVKHHFVDSAIVALLMQSWYVGSATEVYEGPAFHLSAPIWTCSSLAFAWLCYPIISKFLTSRNSLTLAMWGLFFSIAIGVVHRMLHPGAPLNIYSGWGDYQGYYWFPPYILPLYCAGHYSAEIAASLYEPGGLVRWNAFTEPETVFLRLSVDLLFFAPFLGNMSHYDESLIDNMQFGPFARALPTGVACMLATWQEGYFFGSSFMNPIQRLAKYSLVMYIFQMPFMEVFTALVWKGGVIDTWPKLSYFYSSVAMVGLLIFSYLFVTFVEDRVFTRSIDKVDSAQAPEERLPLFTKKDILQSPLNAGVVSQIATPAATVTFA